MQPDRIISLPWPPSVNRIWRAVLGRVILSAAARAYIKAAAAALPAGRVPPPLAGRLWVTLTLHPPERAPRNKGPGATWDIANREKIVCDVLTKQRVWCDDSQIDVMVIQRGAPRGPGSVTVHIVTIPEGCAPI